MVDLNFSPAPPQRTAASRDPWSPLGESGAPGQAGGGDPWGGMGPIISTSTIPDPWGGIGGVGVPPSRGSPLVFGGATSTSPPSAGKTNPDPWSAPAPAQTNNDPWGAPPVTETPAKGERVDRLVIMSTLHVTADPFSPAGGTGDPHDVMAAFGGGPANNNGGFGGGANPGPANPWDMGGLDPLPLLGQNNGQVGGEHPPVTTDLQSSFRTTELSPRALWRTCWESTRPWSTWTVWSITRKLLDLRPRTPSLSSQTHSRLLPLPSQA